MKQRILLSITLLICFTAIAKAFPPDSLQRRAHPFFQTIYHNFSFGGCTALVYYCQPFAEKKLQQLPIAYSGYVSPLKSSWGSLGLLMGNGNVRFFGIYYHDKAGVEFAFNSFGGEVKMDDFMNYIQSRYPAYNTSSYKYNSRYFSGPLFTLTYLLHWRKFVAAPKLSIGFEKQDIFRYSQTYKMNGSNQFVEHSIDQSVVNTHSQHSYHAGLDLGRRFNFRNSVFHLEAGIRTEYIVAPYSMDVHTLEKPYGQPATESNFRYKSVFQMWDAGVYFTFVILKSKVSPTSHS